MAGQDETKASQAYLEDMVGLLRRLIALPAESCREEARCRLMKETYDALGFDEVFIDRLGTVVARVGDGPRVLLLDGHIDTVGIGDPAAWSHDPFEGKLEDGKVWGRGAVDELPGVVCMAYGAKLLMDRGVPDDLTLYLTASVMEEWCEGLAHTDLLASGRIRRPQGVVLGEPTNLAVYRGQRGRLEARITVKGRAAHGAQPQLGENALYKAAAVLRDLEALNSQLPTHEFLGKGSLVASDIECTATSRNAVPGRARIYVDRRLTVGESPEEALQQLRSLSSLGDGEVEVETFESVAWTGEAVSQENIYPTWIVPESDPFLVGMVQATRDVLGTEPEVGRWAFSTNGVATMGRFGIPTVGFAPGLEDLSHTTEEWVAVDDLVRAAAVYARMAEVFAKGHH